MSLYLWSIISLPLGLQLPRWVRELKLCAAADLALVWWGAEPSNKPSLWIREPSWLRALTKLAWLHMYRPPHAQRSQPNQPRDSGDHAGARIYPGLWGNLRCCVCFQCKAALYHQDQSSSAPLPSINLWPIKQMLHLRIRGNGCLLFGVFLSIIFRSTAKVRMQSQPEHGAHPSWSWAAGGGSPPAQSNSF